MRQFATRSRLALVGYLLTAVVWLSTFPATPGEMELTDLVLAGLGLSFAGATALVVFRLDLPALEIGWAVFVYAQLIVFLDAVAEGPEIVETTAPASIRLVALGIILVGFTRATNRFRTSLEEQNDRLRVLNRVLRHNLRNDISAIVSSLRYFERRADDEKEREVAERGLDRAWQLSDLSETARLVDEILETTEQTAQRTRDLADVTVSAVETVRSEYPAVKIDVTAPQSVPVTAIDGVEAAVENVVENACEHNDVEGLAVEVTVESDSSETGVVRVHDNGSGIPEQELDPLREQSESQLDHESGIGLWFVCWLAEKSDGAVEFEYDDGQTVRLRFPHANRTSSPLSGVSIG